MRTLVRISLLLTLIFTLSLVAVQSQDDEPVTIRLWAASATEPLQNAIDDWNENNPNIQAELVRYSNNNEGNTRLDTALLAEGEIDVYISYGLANFRRRVDAGLAEPLNEYLPDFDVIEEFGTDITIIGDMLYGAPGQGQPYFVYINQNAVEEAGLEVPESWTWEEFTEFAAALTEGAGPFDTKGVILPGWPYTSDLVSYELGADATWFADDIGCVANFDNPLWQEALQTRFELEQVDQVAVTFSDIQAGQLTLQGVFFNEEANMMIGGTWLFASLIDLDEYPHDFVTTFAPVPSFDEDGNDFRPGGLGDWTAVAANSNHPEEAAQFLRWFVTDGYLNLIESGRFGAWKGFTPEEQADAFLSAIGDTAELIDQEAFARVVFDTSKDFSVATMSEGVPQLSQIHSDVAQLVFSGELTSEEAVERLTEQGEAVLAPLCE